jgi:predicted GH43/DUF377 family glycosyl hydrolase
MICACALVLVLLGLFLLLFFLSCSGPTAVPRCLYSGSAGADRQTTKPLLVRLFLNKKRVFNPSVATNNNAVVVSARESATKNELSDVLISDDISSNASKHDVQFRQVPDFYGHIDCRLFIYKEKLWGLAHKLTGKEGLHFGMYLMDIQNERSCLLTCDSQQFMEKNWIPLVKNVSLYFVYSLVPFRLLKAADFGEQLPTELQCRDVLPPPTAPLAQHALRGSSAAVLLSDGNYLVGAHTRAEPYPAPVAYTNSLVLLSGEEPFNILKKSSPFHLEGADEATREVLANAPQAEGGHAPFYFFSGLDIVDNQALLCFGVSDEDAICVVAPLENVMALFQ